MVLLLGLGTGGVGAQSADSAPTTGKRAWTLVPRLSVSETWTDNVGLGVGNRQAEWITEIAPALRAEVKTARFNAFVDYQWREMFYARNSARNQAQNSLTAFGKFEALEKFLFVDFSGAIAQQSISAFGTPSSANSSANANSTETASFQVSPYIRGRLPGQIEYEVRHREQESRAKSTAAADSKSGGWTATVKGGTPVAPISWVVNYSDQEAANGSARKTRSEKWQGLVSYRVDPELRINVNAGSESNDIALPITQRSDTWGYGVEWTPSPRTSVAYGREKRFFGNSHSIRVSHRTPRTTWQYVESRDVTVTQSMVQAPADRGENFNLLFDYLAPFVPDEAVRTAMIESILEAAGIPVNSRATSGFIASRTSVQRSRNLMMMAIGARNTVNVAWTQTVNNSLGGAGAVDDFATSASISQRGLTATWSHQITGLTTLNVSGSLRSSSGAAGQDTRQAMLSVAGSTKLGPKTSASLTLRRNIFDGGSSAPASPSYAESAATASVSTTF